MTAVVTDHELFQYIYLGNLKLTIALNDVINAARGAEGPVMKIKMSSVKR